MLFKNKAKNTFTFTVYNLAACIFTKEEYYKGKYHDSM